MSQKIKKKTSVTTKEKEELTGRRKQFWDLITKKSDKKNMIKMHSSGRKGLFEKGARRSTGMAFDTFLESKKSLGVILLFRIMRANFN